MKARLLKKLLGDTGYIVSNNRDYIAVGSPLCHDLISVDKKTLELKYAMDTWREGRKCLLNKSDSKLLFIWDKLRELIDSGEIVHIINENDTIDNLLPVYTVDHGKLVETFTDAYGWPNVTVEGFTMYDNTYFRTKPEAVEYGIRDYGYAVENYGGKIEEIEQKLRDATAQLVKYTLYVSDLKALQQNLSANDPM